MKTKYYFSFSESRKIYYAEGEPSGFTKSEKEPSGFTKSEEIDNAFKEFREKRKTLIEELRDSQFPTIDKKDREAVRQATGDIYQKYEDDGTTMGDYLFSLGRREQSGFMHIPKGELIRRINIDEGLFNFKEWFDNDDLADQIGWHDEGTLEEWLNKNPMGKEFRDKYKGSLYDFFREKIDKQEIPKIEKKWNETSENLKLSIKKEYINKSKTIADEVDAIISELKPGEGFNSKLPEIVAILKKQAKLDNNSRYYFVRDSKIIENMQTKISEVINKDLNNYSQLSETISKLAKIYKLDNLYSWERDFDAMTVTNNIISKLQVSSQNYQSQREYEKFFKDINLCLYELNKHKRKLNIHTKNPAPAIDNLYKNVVTKAALAISKKFKSGEVEPLVYTANPNNREINESAIIQRAYKELGIDQETKKALQDKNSSFYKLIKISAEFSERDKEIFEFVKKRKKTVYSWGVHDHLLESIDSINDKYSIGANLQTRMMQYKANRTEYNELISQYERNSDSPDLKAEVKKMVDACNGDVDQDAAKILESQFE